jgi:hypothetical protein
MGEFRVSGLPHLSDDKTVAKMGLRWWWYGEIWATRLTLLDHAAYFDGAGSGLR